MSSKKVGVFGIYSTRVAVEIAADSLVRAGFPAADISVLLPERICSRNGSRRRDITAFSVDAAARRF